jgi:exopolyphosphatase/pppGpp-phosphohydrolase
MTSHLDQNSTLAGFKKIEANLEAQLARLESQKTQESLNSLEQETTSKKGFNLNPIFYSLIVLLVTYVAYLSMDYMKDYKTIEAKKTAKKMSLQQEQKYLDSLQLIDSKLAIYKTTNNDLSFNDNVVYKDVD